MWLNPQFIALLIAIVVAVIILSIGLAVVRLIWTKTIDLSKVLTEVSMDGNGRPQLKASLSRFQFLVFTFVVAGLYFVLSLETGYLIDVPNGTLMLIGISGVSYLGSKTITSGSNSLPSSRQTAADNAQAANADRGSGKMSDNENGDGNASGSGNASGGNSRTRTRNRNTDQGGTDGN